MNHYYTDEINTLILISLLKAHGIKKVIASPGTTNISFVGSIQFDPYFEIYSAVDERAAAFMACGLAEESNEPVLEFWGIWNRWMPFVLYWLGISE